MAPTVLALALYGAWTLVTYLLEGRPRTLLRPGATGLRVAYAAIANVGVGVIGAVWVLRRLSRNGVIADAAAGFRGATHALVATVVGAGLGVMFYVAQRPPPAGLTVIGNAYSQILVVSVAEVLVCWAVVGAVVEATLRARGTRLPTLWAAVVASVLFGLYHVAHSPPFNQLPLIAFLTGIGLLTSAFFFISRDIYGTIVLHNFFGLVGVLDALRRADRTRLYERWIPALLGTAAVTVLLLIGLHVAWRRDGAVHDELPTPSEGA